MKDGARSDDPDVQRQLDRLEALGHGGDRSAQRLEPIRDLVGALGNPQDRLPPVFHVAGTNGKGSTIAFLRAGLEAAGKRVHAFTSPHLVRFNERIRLGGQLIDDAALARLLEELLDAVEAHGQSPSFFEATTAAAFLAFAREPADALLLEVGMGGRFDATNIVERPAACGIAALGLDHQRWLGETIEEIAAEKAGIAKPGVPLVVQRQPPAASEPIVARAKEANAPAFVQGRDWTIECREGRLLYHGRSSLELAVPRLKGMHQVDNAGLALAMLDYQAGLDLDMSAVGPMTERAQWPARLQQIDEGKLREQLPRSVTLLLDGAHNREASVAIAHALDKTRVHLVMGALANRDPLAIIAPFTDRLESFTALPVAGHDHHHPDALAAMVGKADSAGTVGFEAAFERLARIVRPGDTVLVTGSLYLAGAFLEANGTSPD